MGRLSARTNPTGIVAIDKGRIGIAVTRAEGEWSFALERLDLSGLELDPNLLAIMFASAGNTNARFELGTLASLNKQKQSLADVSPSQPLKFRLLLRAADDPRIVASAENLRASDDSQADSLLPMEPADLGERIWQLVIHDDGAVLQFNRQVFPNAAGAEGFVPFRTLVLPEALRQVMAHIASDRAMLEDEESPYFPWKRWLDAIGAEGPPDDSEGEGASAEWCDDVIARFCMRHKFATTLTSELLKGGISD